MQAFYGTGWTHNPILEIVNHVGVSASIMQAHDLVVQVSTGCVIAVEQLHDDCSVAPDVVCALEWLILHEMHHADLRHFEVSDGVPVLNLVTRGNTSPRALNTRPHEDWHKIAPCLELQADHDALEIQLDDYSVAQWDDIRTQAAGIAAVMVLVEKADADNGIELFTHPKAATRIFQLLGHVAELWSIPAHANAKARGEQTIRDEDLPLQVEVQAFSNEVVLPVLWDAVVLAEAAEAKLIIADLGSPEDFFADIGRAKLGQWDKLVTVGAKEWVTLKDVNETILSLLSNNHAVN